MDYGSVTSGIEAATVAWHPLGWRPKWFSEIAPFPCKLLKHHYPHIPNLGDMLALETNPTFLHEPISLLVGGTPCQSFSVAGLRGGLADSRGNLALQYCRLLVIKRPRWFVWENVPGVLSSFSNETTGKDLERTGYRHGRDITETADFATLLHAFRECGYCCAWRVLDAQFFGVPQRRRRIFVIGYLGDDWRPPAAVLFESAGMRGNTETGQKTAERTTGALTARSKGRGAGADECAAGHVIPWPVKIAGTLDAGFGKKWGQNNQHINQGAPFFVPCWWDGGQISQTLDAVLHKGQTMPEKNRFPAVLAYPYNQIASLLNRSNPQPGDPAPTAD
jgi:DNA (cytosine-5)-methyltransferase 1